MIALVFTGGTISMAHRPGEGGAVPALSPQEIVAATPGLERAAVGGMLMDDWGRFPGPQMSLDRMWAMRGRVRELAARADITGIVVTHGTDTIEESAYLVARSVAARTPIVFTGAMRTISDAGWDGPANLLDAVRVAACPGARGRGALLVFGGRIFSGLEVTKTHSLLPDAFESPEMGPLGSIEDGVVTFRRIAAPPPPVLEPPDLAGPVDIITVAAGADARLLDASRDTARGVVIAGLGRGNVTPDMYDGVERWVKTGKPVVMTTRVPRGAVGPTYAYHGAARGLVAMGVILGGMRRPQQARLDLLLALGAGLGPGDIRRVFDA